MKSETPSEESSSEHSSEYVESPPEVILAIGATFSIESIQGSVLFLMSNRFDRFDWIYLDLLCMRRYLYAGVGPTDARAARLS